MTIADGVAPSAPRHSPRAHLAGRAHFKEPMSTQIHDIASRFHDDIGSGLILEHDQEIPAEFVSQLRGIKADSGSVREREFMLAASIPTIVVEQWKREGYDVMVEPVRETLKRLREKQLDAFITTNKRV